jgi:hypothetical protein
LIINAQFERITYPSLRVGKRAEKQKGKTENSYGKVPMPNQTKPKGVIRMSMV